MASNEVSEMFAKADIVKKLEEFRPGCDMGERVSCSHFMTVLKSHMSGPHVTN